VKATLLACALAITPIAVHAQAIDPRGPGILPPLEYDRPYPGKLVVVRGDMDYMRATCPKVENYPFALGCSYRLTGGELGVCLVIIADEETLKVGRHKNYGHTWSYNVVLRHEIGHCLGWPANHDGARPLPADGPAVAEQRGAPLRGQWPSDLRRRAEEDEARAIAEAVAAGAKATIEENRR
jgi:hypothetical protein